MLARPDLEPEESEDQMAVKKRELRTDTQSSILPHPLSGTGTTRITSEQFQHLEKLRASAPEPSPEFQESMRQAAEREETWGERGR